MTHTFCTRAGLILGLGVFLSACSPPNEQPSDVKVDTATPGRTAPVAQSKQATQLPGVIECVGTPELEPSTLALSCTDGTDRLVQIEWDTWTTDSATGTAVRETGSQRTRDVQVTLSEPVPTSQGLAFSQVVVDGRVIVL
ncbi:MAG: hypothetical protein Q4G50_00935 [Corynebacterium sp.]|uniref:hypothetical protein n=1 Tax=Corynebacterium sp. TaxID=1720 RepID=UPI0026E0B8F3|nr:hypothetical protein [Corynebacterium sp.]MDO5668546.1 hypothetical protein [Corynebacterium sp.]